MHHVDEISLFVMINKRPDFLKPDEGIEIFGLWCWSFIRIKKILIDAGLRKISNNFFSMLTYSIT